MKSILLSNFLITLSFCQDISQEAKDRFGESSEVLGVLRDLSYRGWLEDWWTRVNNPKPGLLVIDLQNDFITGSLAVPEAEDILELAQEIIDWQNFTKVFFSKDWHPSNHISFFSNLELRDLDPEWREKHPGNISMFDEVVFARDPPYSQVLWPDHCIQESEGANIHPSLNYPIFAIEILKGQDPEIDSYSAFFDNGGNGDTGLKDLLKDFVTEVVVIGLATDYCVGSTTIDAQKIGIPATLLTDASRGVSDTTVESMLDRVQDYGGCVSTWPEWQADLETWHRAKHIADTMLRQFNSAHGSVANFYILVVTFVLVQFLVSE
eukprot:TRINITY_DN28511_c0_g1_i1.p1 TRINITY_DN28511_c0_g1~~TRINITY_DN28511_c0_g1_i1.p1  ORF type:complete len:322 (-),score=37.07 TRINITY_DN28511_c0_g1_i1:170-1135(-)